MRRPDAPLMPSTRDLDEDLKLLSQDYPGLSREQLIKARRALDEYLLLAIQIHARTTKNPMFENWARQLEEDLREEDNKMS